MRQNSNRKFTLENFYLERINNLSGMKLLAVGIYCGKKTRLTVYQLYYPEPNSACRLWAELAQPSREAWERGRIVRLF